MKYSKYYHKIKEITHKIIFYIVFILLIWLMLGVVVSFRYDKERYNCKHFSKDAENILESIGIPVEIVTGQPKEVNKRGHMWVRILGIDLEPQCLLFPFPNSLMYPRDITVYEDYKDY